MRAGSRPSAWARSLPALASPPIDARNSTGPTPVEIGALKIVALPARHLSGRSLFNRFQTLWASFALIGPQHRVYYGADSGNWEEGSARSASQYGPFDLTMLEIGASNPLWESIHMGPEGAVRTFRALGGDGLLMPIHWGLFDLALHPWNEPIEFSSARTASSSGRQRRAIH